MTVRCAGAQRTVTYREYYTRCCINTVRPADDEHSVALNMQRIVIINVLYKVILHQVGHLPRVSIQSLMYKIKALCLILCTRLDANAEFIVTNTSNVSLWGLFNFKPYECRYCLNVSVLIYSFIDLDLFYLATLGVCQAMQCRLIGWLVKMNW